MSSLLPRRAALGRFATLLAAGLWPGAQRLAATAGAGEGFSFVVLNDLHHDGPGCESWFDALFTQIATQHAGAALCLALGDLANRGRPESLAAIAAHAGRLPMPFRAVPGNHDNDLDQTTRAYAAVFPGQLNHVVVHAGWQFVLLDSTEGNAWGDTHIAPSTFAWLDVTLPTLDPAQPTVLATHFPLSNVAKYCPLNADELLARFERFNLRGTFSGHYHAQTRRQRPTYDLVTNVCCARVVGNHDGTADKGYFLVHARADGTLAREFVRFAGPAVAT